MYTEVLRRIAGIAVFPVLSLVVFVHFFTSVLVGSMRMDKGQVDQRAALPLDDEPAMPAGARR